MHFVSVMHRVQQLQRLILMLRLDWIAGLLTYPRCHAVLLYQHAALCLEEHGCEVQRLPTAKLQKCSAVAEEKEVHALLCLRMLDHCSDMPPMKVRGFGASPENLAPEKSKPGCCRQAWSIEPSA